MADVAFTTLTPANSVPAISGQAGEALAIGDNCYESAGKWYKVDSNDSTKIRAARIVLVGAPLDGYPVLAQAGALLTATGLMTQTGVYAASNTAGGIALVAEVTGSGRHVIIAGYGVDADTWLYQPVDTTAVVA